MSHIGPFLFLAMRGLIAAIVLTPFARLEQRNRNHSAPNVIPWALFGGMLFFTAGAIQQFGIVTASVTNTGFLTALYVVVTPFVYWLYKRTPPTAQIWIAVALSTIGIWALSGGALSTFTAGEWLVAGSSLLWATFFVATGEAARCDQPITYTCVQFYFVGAVAIAFAWAFEPIVWADILLSLNSILYVGILSSALTFAIMASALRHISAPRASVLLSIETVFAAAAGYLLLGERLDALAWFGAGLILSAILVLRVKPGST